MKKIQILLYIPIVYGLPFSNSPLQLKSVIAISSLAFSPNEKCIYKVFSIYKIENEDYYIKTEFKNDNEFEEFVKNLKKRSIKDFNVDISKDDNILTLSTCANNNKYRIVLHSVRVK